MTTFEQTQKAIVVVNGQGVILLWAGDAEVLIGHKSAEVIGQTLDVIVPADYQERHWSGFRKAMETSTSEAEGIGINLPVNCHDGTIRRLPTRFTLIRDAGGRALGAVAVIAEPRPDDPELYEL